MQTSEINLKIKEIVAGMFDVQAKDIQGTKPFPEMAKYDSMRALEFLAKLENEFGVTIDPDQLPNMTTVDKATQVIEGYFRAK
jgi:acyl carrier protein